MAIDGSGAAYSRFADEMDIETIDLKVKNNYGFGRCGAVKRWCDYNRKVIVLLVFALVLFFVGLVIGYYVHNIAKHDCEVNGHNDTSKDANIKPTEEPIVTTDFSFVSELIDKASLDTYLSKYTQGPHYAGSPDSKSIVADIKTMWKGQGFEVYTKTYNVQLSRPNITHPSRLDVFVDPPLMGDTSYVANDTTNSGMLPGFNPYSPNAIIVAQPVYINYGRSEDFIILRDVAHISVTGRICLVRLGKLSIKNIIENCRSHGGIGVLVFPDALHYAPQVTTTTYPNSWWLPVNATIRDSVRIAFGDPLTPFLPSLDGMAGDVYFPNDFPVHVMGYEQARQYLTIMSYPSAPSSWQGISLYNHSFNIGPGFQDHSKKFKMTVNNVLYTHNITNVFGMIKGSVEPDRYVIVGNHRDSLTYGAVEPGTGTACLMELGSVLGKLYSQGVRPRRTVILASWDAGSDGNIGSAEWVEENAEVLRERAVAYINLDGAVEGNYTFAAAGSPLLTQIMYHATKRVQCPDAAHEKMDVYTNWANKRPGLAGAEIEPLGLGNDAAPFLHVAGVPSLDLRYTYDKDFYQGLPTYPVRHTSFDTYDYVKRFIDPDMSIHAAVTEIVAMAVLSLANDPLLKIQVVDYADALTKYSKEILNSGESNFGGPGALNYLSDVLRRFSTAAETFQRSFYIPPDMTDARVLRGINDRVMSIDRALTGYPGRFFLPQLRHVVYGPSRSGYDGEGFAPLRQALRSAKPVNDWSAVQPVLSATITRIEAAIHLLTENPLQRTSPGT